MFQLKDLLPYCDTDTLPIILQAIELRSLSKTKTVINTDNINKPVVSIGGGISSTLLLPLYCIENNINPLYLYCAVENDDKTLINLVTDKLGINIQRVDPFGNLHNNTFNGYNIFAVFFAYNFLGNSLTDPCSKILKRRAMHRFIKKHKTKTIYLGIKNDELSRWITITGRYNKIGVNAICPLFDNPPLETELEICQKYLNYIPSSYINGFKHNNCSDFCVKAGFKQLEMGYLQHKEQFRIYAKLERLFNIMHTETRTIYQRRIKGERIPVFLDDLFDKYDKEEINEIETMPNCSWCD